MRSGNAIQSGLFPLRHLRYLYVCTATMARRAIASAAQLRELEGAWEKVATKRIVECALCVGV